MGQKTSGPMTPFDSLVTPPYLHTIKLLLPYIPSDTQRFLAIYIKFLELHNTMTCFRGFSNFHCSSHILDDLKPYMSASEMEMAEQMGSMMNMLEMVQCMQTMSDNTYDDPKSKGAAVNPMDILKNIMTPEQQDMFNMYSNMFDQEISRPQTDSKKGESDNE